MAVVESRREALARRRAALESLCGRIEARLAGAAEPMEAETGPVGGAAAAAGATEGAAEPLPEDHDALRERLAAAGAELAEVAEAFAVEEERARRWREENARRKHNYIPFLYNFLKVPPAASLLPVFSHICLPFHAAPRRSLPSLFSFPTSAHFGHTKMNGRSWRRRTCCGR